MSEVGTYNIKQIKSILAETKQVGGELLCVFQCPRTKKEFRSSVRIARSIHRDSMDKASRVAKGRLLRTVRTQTLRTVGQLLGAGAAGQIARSVGSTAFSAMETKMRSTNPKNDKDIVEAFGLVQENFIWDEEGNTFYAKDNARDVLEFTAVLIEHPVVRREDRDILVRLLSQLACSDGTVSEDEKEMFSVFASEGDSLESLLNENVPGDEEMLQVRPEIQESIVMIMWAFALSDEELSDKELQFVKATAATWEIKRDRLNILKKTAARHMILQILSGEMDDGETAEAVRRIAESAQISDGEMQKLKKAALG